MTDTTLSIPKFENFQKVFKNRNFLFLWVSQALSVFCAQMLNFVLIYVIFQETGSSFYVSLLFVFYFLPVFILGLFSGIIVDFLSRRKILIITNLLQSLIVLLYLLIGKNWAFIFPVIFLYSMADEFYYPAETALLSHYVHKDQLPVANFLFLLGSYGGIGLGFTLAGQIIKLIGVDASFILASVLLFIAMIASVLLKKDQPDKNLSFFHGQPISKMKKEIKENYQFIIKNKVILFSLMVLLFFQIAVGTLGISMPVLGTKVLHINFLDLGIKLIVPVIFGSLIGTFIVDRYIKNKKKTMISFSLFTAGILVAVIGVFGLLHWVSYPVIAVLLFLIGFDAVVILITSQSTFQGNTPKELMGRVSGTYKLLQSVLILFPTLFAGAIIDLIGIFPVIFGLSGIVIIFSIFAFLNSRRDFSQYHLKRSDQ